MTASAALQQPIPVMHNRRFFSSLTICGIWSMAVAYLMMLITFTIYFHNEGSSGMFLWFIVTALVGLASYFSPPGMVERKASKILFVLVLAGIMALVGFITTLIIAYIFSNGLFEGWQHSGGMRAFGFYLATGITLTLFGALSGVGRAVLLSMERRALVMGAVTSAIGWALGAVFVVLWLQMTIVEGPDRFEMLFNEYATSFGLLFFLATYALPWLLLENDIKKFPLKYLPREERIRERGRIATVSDRVQLFGIERFNKPKQAPDFPSLKEPDRNEGRVWWKLRATASEDGRAVLLIALNGYMNSQTAADFWKMLGNCIESGWDMVVIDISCVKEWVNVDMSFSWQVEADRRDARVILSRPDRMIQDAVVNSSLPHNFGVVRKGQAAFDYFNSNREGKIPVEVIASDAGKPRLTVDAISSRAAPNSPFPDLPSPQGHAFRYFQWKAEPFRTADARPAVVIYVRGKLRRHTGYEVNELLDLYGRAGWRLIVLNLTDAEEQAIVGVIHSFTDHLYDRGGILVLVGAMGPLLIPREGRDAVAVSYASDNLRAQQLLNQICHSVQSAQSAAPVAPLPALNQPVAMRVAVSGAGAAHPGTSGLNAAAAGTVGDTAGGHVAITVADPGQFTDVFRPGGPFAAIQQTTRDLGPNVSITQRAERTPAQLPVAAIYIKGELIAAYNYELTSAIKRLARAGWRAFNVIFKQRPSVQVQHNFFNLRRELERTNTVLVLTCTAEVKIQLDERLDRAVPVNVSRQLSGQEIDRSFGISYQVAPSAPAAMVAPAQPVTQSASAATATPFAPVNQSAPAAPMPWSAAVAMGDAPVPDMAPVASEPADLETFGKETLPIVVELDTAKPPAGQISESYSAPVTASHAPSAAEPPAEIREINQPAVATPALPMSATAPAGGSSATRPAVDDDLRAGAADLSAGAVEAALATPYEDATANLPTAAPERLRTGGGITIENAGVSAGLPTPGLSATPPVARVTKSGPQVPVGRPNRPDGLPVHDHQGSQFQLKAERVARPVGDLVILHVGGLISRDRGDSLLSLRIAFEALAGDRLGRVIIDCTDLKTLHEGQFLADQRAPFRAIGPGCDLVLCNLPRRLQVVCGMAKWDQKLKIVNTLDDAKRLFP